MTRVLPNLALHHPLSPQALAFTADAFNTNFLAGRNVSQTGDIWHVFSIEL